MWKRLKQLWEIVSHLDTVWSLLSAISWGKILAVSALPLVSAVIAYMEGLPFSSIIIIALCVLTLLVAIVAALVSMKKAKMPSVVDESVSEQTFDVKEERLRLADIEVENQTALCDLYKKEVGEKEKQYQSLQEESKLFKLKHGRWRIKECGRSHQTLNLSVAIQFIDSQDADLAERIYGFFWSPMPEFPWRNARPIEQVRWFKNPSSSARIVIFSDHDNAAGIEAAFNDCELLEEKVDRFDRAFAMEQQMISDVVFVIFPK